MEFHKGASIVYNELTRTIGVSFKKSITLITCPPNNFCARSIIMEQLLEMEKPKDDECYFLSVPRAAAHDIGNTLSVVHKNALKDLALESFTTDDMSRDESFVGTVPGRGFGLVFPSIVQSFKHFPAALLNYFPDYDVPMALDPGCVAFLSLETILCAPQLSQTEGSAFPCLVMVAPSEITIARCAHSYDGAVISQSSHPQPVVAAKPLRTPAPVAIRAGPHSFRSGATSTSNGRTTIATDGASTIADSAPGTAHSVGSSSSEDESMGSDSSDSEMSVDSPAFPTPPKPQQQHQQQRRGGGKSAPTPGTGRKRQPSLVSSAAAAPKARARPTAPAALSRASSNSHGSSSAASDGGCYRVAGRSDVRSAPTAGVVNEVRRGETKSTPALPLMKQHWGNMKRLYGWRCIYYRAVDNIEVYTVPLRDLTPVRDLVENIDFFHTREVLEAHLADNPCLTEDWEPLFHRLGLQGWKRLEDPQSQVLCYYYDVRFSYIRGVSTGKAKAPPTSIADLRERGLLPGQHLFVSKLATMQFIARFPYLLQEDGIFLDTLARLGWQVDVTSRKVTWEYSVADLSNTSRWAINPAGGKTVEEEWILLDELRRRLWLCPERLFQNSQPSVPTSVLADVLRLEEEYSLCAEGNTPSPSVKGMTRDQRDAALRDVRQLLRDCITHYSAKHPDKRRLLEINQERAEELLYRLQWRRQQATWSQEWWRNDECWVAPWLDNLLAEGNQTPVLGKDFFWTTKALAEYSKSADGHPRQASLSVLLARPAFSCPVLAIRAEERQHAEEQLKLCAHNHEAPFATDRLDSMLRATGWTVFVHKGDTVYIPHWRTAEVKQHNYLTFTAGQDYFVKPDEALIDHIVEFGNMSVAEYQQRQGAVSELDYFSEPSSPENANPVPRLEDQYRVHCGECYPLDSEEAEILEEVLKPQPWFPAVLSGLRQLGWITAWSKELNSTVIVPTWAKHCELFEGKYAKCLAALTVNVDYFVDSPEGKAELFSYLRRCGFQRSESDLSFAPLSAQAQKLVARFHAAQGIACAQDEEARQNKKADQKLRAAEAKAAREAATAARAEEQRRTAAAQAAAAKASARAAQVAAEPADADTVVIAGVAYERDGVEHFIYEKVCEEAPHYGTVYGHLRSHLNWYSTYSTGWPNSRIIAPWALTHAPDAFEVVQGRPKPKCLRIELLAENIDYFEDTKEGHHALLRYIKERGFTRQEQTAIDSTLTAESAAPADTAMWPAELALPSMPSVPISSSPVFANGTVVHYGRTYPAGSAGYALMELLFPQDRRERIRTGPIISILKQDLDWGAHFDARLDRHNYAICASWSLTIPGAFTEDNGYFQLIQPELLKKNVDYFVDDEVGRDNLVAHLREFGFEAPPGRLDFPAAKEAASLPPSCAVSPSQTSAVPAPAVDAPSATALVEEGAAQSRKRKADTDVEEGRPQVALVGAAAATGKANLQKGKQGKKGGRQADQGAGSDADSDTVSKTFDHLTIHRRSPMKACHRAADPSTQFDRLVAAEGSPVYSIPGVEDEEEEESDFEDEEVHMQRRLRQEDPALQGILDLLADDQEDGDDCDTGYLPLTQAPAPSSYSQRSSPRIRGAKTATPPSSQSSKASYHEKDPDGDGRGFTLMQLLEQPNPNFDDVFQILRDNEGWTYQYLTDNTKLPGDRKAVGLQRIFLRAGKSLTTEKMDEYEDYFLHEEDLLSYLRFCCGLVAMPQYVGGAKLQQPRSTRSGRVIELGAEPGTSAEEPVGVPVNAAGSPVLPMSRRNSCGSFKSAATATSPGASIAAEGQNKRPRTGSFAEDVDADSVPGAKKAKASAPLTLRQRAEAAQQALCKAAHQSAYSAGDPQRAAAQIPAERAQEHGLLLKYVLQALTTGAGGAIYLQGLPGTGKTTTAVNVMDQVARLRKSILQASGCPAERVNQAPLGFNVVWRNGTGMKMDDLKSIAGDILNLGSSPITVKDAESLLKERFSAVAAPVVMEGVDEQYSHSSRKGSSSAGYGGARNRPVPLTVLVIDELDSVHPTLLEKLLTWSNRETTSLLLLGIGNITSMKADLFKHAVMNPIDFVPYDEPKLKAIVSKLTYGVFEVAALTLLAKRVCSHQKCDVRRLLGFAVLALKKAEGDIPADSAVWSDTKEDTHLVKMSHVWSAINKTDATVDNINGLTENARLLLASLFLYDNLHSGVGGWTLVNMETAFRTLLESKSLNLQSRSHGEFRKHVSELEDYGQLRAVAKGYTVMVTLETLLRCNWSASLKAALATKHDQQKQQLGSSAAAAGRP